MARFYLDYDESSPFERNDVGFELAHEPISRQYADAPSLEV